VTRVDEKALPVIFGAEKNILSPHLPVWPDLDLDLDGRTDRQVKNPTFSGKPRIGPAADVVDSKGRPAVDDPFHFSPQDSRR